MPWVPPGDVPPLFAEPSVPQEALQPVPITSAVAEQAALWELRKQRLLDAGGMDWRVQTPPPAAGANASAIFGPFPVDFLH